MAVLELWKNMGRAPIAASPDGKYIAITRDQSKYQAWVEVFQAKNFRWLYRVRPDRNEKANVLTFSPDGQNLYSGHTGVTIYAARNGKLVWAYNGSDGVPEGAVAFSFTGEKYAVSVINTVNQNVFYVADVNANVPQWIGQHDPPKPAQSIPSNWIHSLAFSPYGRLLATGSGGGGITFYDLPKRQRLGHLTDTVGATTAAMQKGWTAHAGAVSALHFLSGSRLISASQDGMLKLWNVTDGKLLSRHRLPDGLKALRVAPDGTILAANKRGLVLLNARKDVLQVEETMFNPQDPFTDLSVTNENHVWTITRGGTLAHWLLLSVP